MSPLFFFFNDTATTETSALSLPDSLPISPRLVGRFHHQLVEVREHVVELRRLLAAEGGHVGQDRLLAQVEADEVGHVDRKSTRLNSSHANISYAVFCLKKNVISHIFAIRS